jgi:hypothetical protein
MSRSNDFKKNRLKPCLIAQTCPVKVWILTGINEIEAANIARKPALGVIE